jgi:hypothetical protein
MEADLKFQPVAKVKLISRININYKKKKPRRLTLTLQSMEDFQAPVSAIERLPSRSGMMVSVAVSYPHGAHPHEMLVKRQVSAWQRPLSPRR